MSVKISSTAETTCTTNCSNGVNWLTTVERLVQQIALMELGSYSWPTCSKQLQLVDCHIGAIDELDWRQQYVLLTMQSTCRGAIIHSLGQSSRGKNVYLWKYPRFLTRHCRTGRRKLVSLHTMWPNNRWTQCRNQLHTGMHQGCTA